MHQARNSYLLFTEFGDLIAEIVTPATISAGMRLTLTREGADVPHRILRPGIWMISPGIELLISPTSGHTSYKMQATRIGLVPRFETDRQEAHFIEDWEQKRPARPSVFDNFC